MARNAEGLLKLWVDVTMVIAGAAGLFPSYQRAFLEINASDWFKVQREMKFEDRATFEDGGRVGPPLDKAAEHMRAALDHVQKHDWKAALVECREVLDQLGQHQSVLPSWPQQPDWSKATTWGVAERSVAMQWAVRHLTHAGAHAKIGTAEEHEVRLAVAMTGAVLRYYASR